MELTDILKKYFGYEKFRPGQQEIIEAIIKGNNVLAILPTGAGKSICYQIPALICNSFAVIISPLIALMKDQVDSLNHICRNAGESQSIAAFINSTLDYRESEKVLNEISLNKTKLLYLSPEKLTNQSFIEKIKSLNPEYLFVDEAHCVSQWGHNFRPSYRKIKDFAQFCSINKVSAFTATATPEVRKDIIEQLNLKEPKIFVTGFERANISINVIKTNNKKEKCVEILSREKKPAIIYTATRRNTEELTEYLVMNKINAAFYHAGVNSQLRKIIQDDFISGRLKVIVATNAFGMGIDKSDIRTIIHYNMPGSIENYYQEIGRAGRDNLESKVYLLYNNFDRAIQEFLILNSHPTFELVSRTYNLLNDYAKIALGNISDKEIPIDENLTSFLESKGINKNLLPSILNVLTNSEYISIKDEYYKAHYIKFACEENQLKNYLRKSLSNNLKEIIIYLLRKYGNRLFISMQQINIEKISSELGIPKVELIESFDALSNSGIIELEKPSIFPTIKFLKTRVKIDNLLLDLEQVNSLLNNAKEKLNKMIEFVHSNECRFKFIIDYFGEEAKNFECRKCDNCTGSTPLSTTKNQYLKEIILDTILEVDNEINSKTLINILRGDKSSNNFSVVSSFGSCRLFSEQELLFCLNELIDQKKIINKNGLLTAPEKNTDEKEIEQENSHDYEADLELYNKLRTIRQEASDKFSQPPYMICSDEILREIVRVRPKNPSELMSIKNFTLRMFNKVGENFLSAIKEFIEKEKVNQKFIDKDIPQNIKQIYELINKKYLLEDICKLVKLPEAVVSMQIESIIELFPETNIKSLIKKDELDLIQKNILGGLTDLKELKKSLPSNISYGKIRIVLAKNKYS
ncbi:RecQ family ATP-dependent DNA helicase [Melioribacteraceae bacterium 4301-Me]|uniref:RecQ family ATP-dependent DNA helicase n=1 Tax=Pyranulibacter aquaticus TaxID=3163344 RepID=UPI0035953B17